MPRVLLQESVPYSESRKWDIHRNYFMQRGAAAWQKGEVPYYITSNTAAALQAAKMVLAAVRQMEKEKTLQADEPIVILEQAAGVGLFAYNFIRMFKHLDAEGGGNNTRRLRYIFTDYSPKTVAAAAALPKMQGFIQEGILIFGTMDALDPQAARALDGGSLPLTQLTAIFSNYLQCCLPLTILRRTTVGWREKYTCLLLDVPEDADQKEFLRRAIEEPVGFDVLKRLTEETEYLPLRENVIRDPMHLRLMDDMAKDFEKVTLPYPYGSIQNIEKTLPMLREGGIMLHTDKGYASVNQWKGLRECEPSLHGNCFAHSYNFPLIQGIFQTLDFASVHTEDPDRGVKTLLIEKRPQHALDTVFHTLYVDEDANREMKDYNSAYDALVKEDPASPIALRFLRKALAVAPGDGKVLYRLASHLKTLERYEESLELYRQCEEADLLDQYDCAFYQGLVLHNLGRYQEAIEEYTRSLTREDHATVRTNLGLCYEAVSQPDKARECFEHALRLQPNYEKAQRGLGRLPKPRASVRA